MRIPNTRLFPRLCSGTVLANLWLCTYAAIPQSSAPRSQVIYLPDPTPRETDPHLLLKDNQQAGAVTQEALEHRNAKRRELVVWAANELVILSQRLETDLTNPKTEVSKADAAANAARIEQLAKNLTAALKAQ